ncbi:tryptophan-rich sensory protein [Corynebacterium sp. YIM 101645]|uniref:Tryptophan-rich sensory protein n=1 Tax=Corynebacterium lemuris TaxID=1859292 RepID=A0ABT2FU86_9CORY|nr:tryptophan-rich sensory protein [Corynebacterium lemuris]MCS5478068.1 tryptophan-rich sensory protein [Corynebacterium lemuris]
MSSTTTTTSNVTTTTRDNNWLLPVITLIGTAVAIGVAFLGSGAIGGTPINQAAGGALTADSTPLAPGGPAFRIWTVIYLGLIGYAFWQLTKTARASDRQHALRPWAVASLLLNAAWIWMVQLGSLIASVVVIVVLLAVLIRIMFILGRPRTGGIVEQVLTDGAFGLYFGWVLVATFANTWAWLSDAGLEILLEVPLGVTGIIVAAVVAVLAAILDGGRIAPALATAWGLAWIAIARTEGQFESQALVWTAGIAAAVVLLSPAVGRLRRR